MAYEIVNNVPLPDESRGRTKGEVRLTIERMEVGDSFLLESKRRFAVNKIAQVLGISLTTRREGDLYRVWRYK
jgi:hypothetical protein